MEYRLIHFNTARPLGEFKDDNEFLRVFLSILPRVFAEADSTDGLHWHMHGLRRPTGDWCDFTNTFPYPEGMGAPDVCTMAGWTSLDHLQAFAYSGRTHPPSMRRLANGLDRSSGPSFVMWWAPRGQRFTLLDGWAKLEMLRALGPSDQAFSLDQPVARPVAA